jgi:predicted nucleic acid-binding Zn ribbon protein
MRNKHQISECQHCGEAYCVDCSDATSLSRKYCSEECRLLDNEGQAVRREDRTGYYSGRTA